MSRGWIQLRVTLFFTWGRAVRREGTLIERNNVHVLGAILASCDLASRDMACSWMKKPSACIHTEIDGHLALASICSFVESDGLQYPGNTWEERIEARDTNVLWPVFISSWS